MDFYGDLKRRFCELIGGGALLKERVAVVSARTLTASEAMGEPGREEYPLLRGKEFMIEASLGDARGQAFTDMPGEFRGSLSDILGFGLVNNFERAVFVASLNAVLRRLGRVTGTVHCRDSEPGLCAQGLVPYLQELYGKPRVALFGFQPAMAERLARAFPLRMVDLDKNNIGSEKFGIIVQGPEGAREAISWCDIVLATGSSSVNGTIGEVMGGKRMVFYGVTISGISALLGYRRYCPLSR